MSVRVNERGEQPLKVLNSATGLAAYTVKICANDNSFPKKYRWALTNEIVKEAINIQSEIRKANRQNLYNDITRDKRYKHQAEAFAACDALLGLIDIAYKVFNFSAKRLEYWVGLVLQVEDDLKSWRDSDARRVAKHKK